MFKYREIKKLIFPIVIYTVFLIFIVYRAFDFYSIKLNEEIIKRDTAIIGNLDKNEIDYGDIVGIMTRGYDEENYKRGENILKEYGYNYDIDMKYQGIIKKQINTKNNAIIFIIFSILPIFYIFLKTYKKTYEEIDKIISFSDQIISGNYLIELDYQAIGNINLLKYKFNKMVDILNNNIENLNREKKFLKDNISDISHQLKTPLASLQLFNELMIIDGNMTIEKRVEFLEKSKNQLERMSWLTINLLKVAKIESNSIEFKVEKIDVEKIIKNVLNNVEMISKDMDIVVKTSGEIINVDSHWLEEAITNIVKNAIEYGEKEVIIQCNQGPIFTDIKIIDDGNGIENAKIPFIFDRFYRDNRNTDSVGIGLNLAKIIIERQGGIISVKSKIGKGTEFNIRFIK